MSGNLKGRDNFPQLRRRENNTKTGHEDLECEVMRSTGATPRTLLCISRFIKGGEIVQTSSGTHPLGPREFFFRRKVKGA